jgi:hypothetical protein
LCCWTLFTFLLLFLFSALFSWPWLKAMQRKKKCTWNEERKRPKQVRSGPTSRSQRREKNKRADTWKVKSTKKDWKLKGNKKILCIVWPLPMTPTTMDYLASSFFLSFFLSFFFFFFFKLKESLFYEYMGSRTQVLMVPSNLPQKHLLREQ